MSREFEIEAADEARRLAALDRYQLAGSPREADYDRLTRLGVAMFGTAICAISVVGKDRLWLKSRHGTEIDTLQRAHSFCGQAIRDDDPLVVPDAQADPRFSDSELVRAGIRFYAGAPLIAPGGERLGTFCVLDTEPRAFTGEQKVLLEHMAGIVVDHFERRHVNRAADILVPFAHVALHALVTTDGAGRITFWNDGAASLFGYTHSEIEGENVDLIVPERFRAAHREGIARIAACGEPHMTGRVFELIALRRDGTEFPAELSLSVWHGALGLGIGAQIQDISERKAREDRLQHLADHDHLTGLLNRKSFRAGLDMQLELAAEAALLVVDLDGFKGVNDSLGHAAGDTLLQALALRLSTFAQPREMLARLGGDEFAVLLERGRNSPTPAMRADALLDAISRPFAICGHQLHLSGSIGIAIAPLQADDADELMVRADLALFRAKSEGGGRYRMFDSGMESRLSITRAFQDELRDAFGRRQLELHYQPQVRLDDGMVVGAEALLRWRHPTRGLLLPEAFLDVLETHAFAYETGNWVLDEACRTLAQWRGAGLNVRMAVNLFAAQLQGGRLGEVVDAALTRHGLSPADLELEITETIALRHDERSLQPLRDLHARGIGIAFDDFGTGFASLSTLKDFPLSRLKIDRSFVQDLCSDPHSQAIAKGVVTIGHSLGLDVIAEGIETTEQAALLRGWGCDGGQGFWYGRAVPAAEFAALFAAGR